MSKKKADIYNELVQPMMTKALEICKEHDIPFIASAQLDDDRQEALRTNMFHVTSHFTIPEDQDELSNRFKGAIEMLFPKESINPKLNTLN